MNDANGNLPHLNISAQDLLAAIAFEAQRIVAASQQHAAGYPFPAPQLLQDVINRMTHLNSVLLQFNGVIPDATQGDLTSKSGMKAELN